MRALGRPAYNRAEAMRGHVGRLEAVNWRTAVVRLGSERWNANTHAPLVPGQSVLVLDVEGLTVTVHPSTDTPGGPEVSL